MCSENRAVHLAGAPLVREMDTLQVCEEAQVTQEGQRGCTHPRTLWSCLLRVSPALNKAKVPLSHQEHVCWILFYPVSVRQNQIFLFKSSISPEHFLLHTHWWSLQSRAGSGCGVSRFAIDVLPIFGAVWCSWCPGGMGCFSSGSLLGVCVSGACWAPASWSDSRPPHELLAVLGSLCSGREGLRNLHGGLTPPAATQAALERGLCCITLSFYSFSIASKAGLTRQQEVSHCREGEYP